MYLQDAPLLMPVASRAAITGRGTVVIGTIEEGSLKKGDKVEIKGAGDAIKAIAADIQVFGKTVKQVGNPCLIDSVPHCFSEMLHNVLMQNWKQLRYFSFHCLLSDRYIIFWHSFHFFYSTNERHLIENICCFHRVCHLREKLLKITITRSILILARLPSTVQRG